jgi:AraC-like DNA-binding protein
VLPLLASGFFFLALALQNLKICFHVPTNKAALVISGLCGIFSWFGFYEALGSGEYTWPKMIMYSFYWLLGPLTYLLTSSMFQRHTSWRALFHLLPWLSVLMLLHMTLFWSHDKHAYAQPLAIAKQVFVLGYITTLVIYLVRSWHLLLLYRRSLKQELADPEPHQLQWLQHWLGFMLLLSLYVLIIEPLLTWYTQQPSMLEPIINLCIAGFSLYLLLLPPLATQVHPVEVTDDAERITDESCRQSDGPEAFSSHTEPDSSIVALAQELRARLIQDALYRQNGLTLKQLAASVGCSHQQASLAINQGLACNFYELVNRLRIDYAARQLIEHPSTAILTIALDAGFNSKTAFYNAFRRAKACTPSEYRHTHRQSKARS